MFVIFFLVLCFLLINSNIFMKDINLCGWCLDILNVYLIWVFMNKYVIKGREENELINVW